ncbi:NADPH-dependent F420 reductase [Rhodophyticola porphyridii]|uniref:Dinucleotide-binding enzyme n=1 Tax=Rhodophyticola porphyridii TaxID=1852017 RepID=A0A3L9Y3X9_9RHOB|nr:NADPH-dependent F420 reductase [Rhodophyticola porphyridii]RMA41787.1 dinucleotide-binding enzyme [Rhodophyticola porphyridii]
MKIAIIGAGDVGRALGTNWAKAGHEIRYGTRTQEASDEMTPREAADWGAVVVLALPWAAAKDVSADLGTLAGKPVIDCMNPIARGPDGMGLALGHTSSGAEQVQAWLPEAHVIKTLNQVGAEVMADTSGFALRPLQLMAGNDDGAKSVIAGLLDDLGFEPLDAGDLVKARLLEPFALVWINQALMRGKGRNWAFGAMPRAGQ